MALDTRLIGQALGGGRPLDLAGAVRPAIARGEQAFAKRQFEENRRKELQAKAIAQLPQLDESQIPSQMREWATGQAAEIRQRALDVIRNKDLDPVERQLAISNAMGDINKVAAQANDFKQWIAQFADTLPDDLSKLNSPELMERINDIYQGNYKVVGNEFIFNDGTVKDFNSLVNTRHITRRSDAYMSQLKALGNDYEKYGLQGWDEAAFDKKIDNELASEKYTDSDIASIAVDELNLDASTIKAIQDDFEDNGILDTVDKQSLIDQIKGKYKAAAKDAYDNAKRLYDERLSIKQQQAAAKNGGFGSKWEYDAWLEGQEKRANAVYIKPLQKFLPTTPVNEQQALELLSYANNNIPNIEIYQNPATDDDGELIAPNNYVIEVNGKQKFFEIGKTPGSTILKYIQDLYGYNAMERNALFGIDEKEEEDEFSQYEAAPGSIATDIEKVLEEERNKDTLNQLEPTGAAERARLRIQREQAGLK